MESTNDLLRLHNEACSLPILWPYIRFHDQRKWTKVVKRETYKLHICTPNILMRDWKYLFYSRHIHVICLPPYCQKFTSLLVILKNLHSDWNSSRKKWKIEEQRPFHKATARLALYFFVLEIISLCFFLILSTCINECKSSSLPYPDRWLVARLVSLLAIGCRYRPHEYGHKSNGEVRTTTGTNRVASEE